MKKHKKTFSLVELMIVVLISAMLIPVLLRGIVGCFMLNAVTRDSLIASADARLVVEQMRSLSKTAVGLATISGINWANWAATNGVNNLPAEAVVVIYTDLDGSGDPLDDDPLAVTVRIDWQGREQRANNLSLSTLLTLY